MYYKLVNCLINLLADGLTKKCFYYILLLIYSLYIDMYTQKHTSVYLCVRARVYMFYFRFYSHDQLNLV